MTRSNARHYDPPHITRWCAYFLGAYRFAAGNRDASDPAFIENFLRFNPRADRMLARHSLAAIRAEFARLDRTRPALSIAA